MQVRTLAFVGFVSLLGFAGRAKADTIDFTFVSTPNSSGTYVDAWGTIPGNVTYGNSADPADLNVLVTNSGATLTVVSNVPPSPDPNGEGTYPLTPELNGSALYGGSGGYFQFSNSPNGIVVSNTQRPMTFFMPGNPDNGGPYFLYISVSGVNGAANNSQLIAGDQGNGPEEYFTDGTLTLYGQVGAYELTPEPPSWLLLASGVALLGFMFHRRSVGLHLTL
jgi:hypothetical protein